MTGQEALLDFLRKQRAADETPPPGNWQELKSEWVESLRRLRNRLKEYLSGAQNEGLIRVREVDIVVHEREDRAYSAPALRIEGPAGGVVDVLPRARLIVGATGRVDLVSGRAHALLVRFGQDEWAFMRLAENGGEWERRDLTADSLSDVLLGLLR